MRAAAAERRLAALSGPKLEPLDDKDLVKGENGSDGPVGGLSDDDDDVDVEDPHYTPAVRRKQMEDEMSEDERRGLRGGWEDLFPSLASSSVAPPVKRERSPTRVKAEEPQPKRRGASIVHEEWKRGVGLSHSSAGRDGKVLGSRLQPVMVKDDDDESPSTTAEWDCKLCTYANGRDRRSCGEYLPSVAQLMTEMCGALPDGHIPHVID